MEQNFKKLTKNTHGGVICSLKKTQQKSKLVQVNTFLSTIVWIMTTTKILGYLNFSRAIENYIWIAQRAVVEK